MYMCSRRLLPTGQRETAHYDVLTIKIKSQTQISVETVLGQFYQTILMPQLNAGTVLFQDIHAEIKNIIFIALSSYLTTPANFPSVTVHSYILKQAWASSLRSEYHSCD